MLCKELQNQRNTIGKPYILSRFNILKTSGFGKPSPDHSFTSEACFEHTFIHILRSDLLSPQDLKTVLHCHPLFEHLFQILTQTKIMDFSSLKNPIANFSEQKYIATSRVKQFLAVIPYYDLDLPALIKSLGGNYTGKHSDLSSTLKALRVAHCDKVDISDVKRTLLTGCLNKMNAFSSYPSFLEFKRCDNHTTIKKNIDQVIKNLKKENRNQYLLLFPNWLVRFFKNVHLTPQGLLSKPSKNDRLIQDRSF